MKKATKNEAQLSLFESNDPPSARKPTMIDLLRDRFENEEIKQEDYKKWIRFLVQNSFRSDK
jgi:hypothetical protein